MNTAMRGYLSTIAVCSVLLAVDRFEILDLGGFANGLILIIIVLVALALSASVRRGGIELPKIDLDCRN